MDALDETTKMLKEFLETKPASRQAVSSLKKGVEIGVVVNQTQHFAYFQENGEPQLVARNAINPDVVFYLNSQAVENLLNKGGEDMAAFGIEVLREYLAENLKIKVPGSMLNIATHGYLNIIKEAGVPFFQFLAAHGLVSIGKIVDAIKKLKKS